MMSNMLNLSDAGFGHQRQQNQQQHHHRHTTVLDDSALATCASQLALSGSGNLLRALRNRQREDDEDERDRLAHPLSRNPKQRQQSDNSSDDDDDGDNDGTAQSELNKKHERHSSWTTPSDADGVASTCALSSSLGHQPTVRGILKKPRSCSESESSYMQRSESGSASSGSQLLSTRLNEAENNEDDVYNGNDSNNSHLQCRPRRLSSSRNSITSDVSGSSPSDENNNNNNNNGVGVALFVPMDNSNSDVYSSKKSVSFNNQVIRNVFKSGATVAGMRRANSQKNKKKNNRKRTISDPSYDNSSTSGSAGQATATGGSIRFRSYSESSEDFHQLESQARLSSHVESTADKSGHTKQQLEQTANVDVGRKATGVKEDMNCVQSEQHYQQQQGQCVASQSSLGAGTNREEAGDESSDVDDSSRSGANPSGGKSSTEPHHSDTTNKKNKKKKKKSNAANTERTPSQ